MALVVGALRRFWLDKSLLFVCVVVAALGTACQLLVCAFRSTGYQNLFWDSSRAAPVPRVTVDILERVSMVSIMLIVFALFAWTILDALVETFFAKRRSMIRIIAISAIVATTIAALYALTMAIVTAVAPSNFFLVDATPLVIPLLSVSYAAGLVVLLSFVTRLVKERKQEDANYNEAKRNATIFLIVISVLAVILALYSVITFLYYFGVGWESEIRNRFFPMYLQFRLAYLILGSVSLFSIVISLLLYVSIPLIRGFADQKTFSKAAQGYVQMPESEDHIPLQYEA